MSADFGIGEIMAGIGYSISQGVPALAANAAPAIEGGAMAVSSVASAGTGIYSALNAPKIPGMPSQTDYAKQQEAAAQSQAEALLKRRGMASTILTSPLGASGSPGTKGATLGA